MDRLGIRDIENLSPEDKKRLVRLNIDLATVTFRRVVDTNDRFLREITVGQGPQEKGKTRVTGFDITVASEVRFTCHLSRCTALGPHGLKDACV